MWDLLLKEFSHLKGYNRHHHPLLFNQIFTYYNDAGLNPIIQENISHFFQRLIFLLRSTTADNALNILKFIFFLLIRDNPEFKKQIHTSSDESKESESLTHLKIPKRIRAAINLLESCPISLFPILGVTRKDEESIVDIKNLVVNFNLSPTDPKRKKQLQLLEIAIEQKYIHADNEGNIFKLSSRVALGTENRWVFQSTKITELKEIVDFDFVYTYLFLINILNNKNGPENFFQTLTAYQLPISIKEFLEADQKKQELETELFFTQRRSKTSSQSAPPSAPEMSETSPSSHPLRGHLPPIAHRPAAASILSSVAASTDLATRFLPGDDGDFLDLSSEEIKLSPSASPRALELLTIHKKGTKILPSLELKTKIHLEEKKTYYRFQSTSRNRIKNKKKLLSGWKT